MSIVKFYSILTFLIFWGFGPASGQTSQISINEKISVDVLESKLKTTKNIQLIDVRSPEEYAEGYIEGAQNINFHDTGFSADLDKLNKEIAIFIYCGVGGRSGKTATILSEKGFVEIYDLKGGFTEWIRSNKPVKQ